MRNRHMFTGETPAKMLAGQNCKPSTCNHTLLRRTQRTSSLRWSSSVWQDVGFQNLTQTHMLPYGKLTVCYSRWPIEIDGLPINSMVIFHGYVSHNQMVDHFSIPTWPWRGTHKFYLWTNEWATNWLEVNLEPQTHLKCVRVIKSFCAQIICKSYNRLDRLDQMIV